MSLSGARNPGKPTIISKAEWNALSEIKSKLNEGNTRQYIIVHNTGDEKDAISKIYGTNDKGFMKREQEMHIQDKDCGDIGYNFGIGIGANILEGRNPKYVGAHALDGYNSKSIGVVILGNYNIRSFTSNQKQALIDLLAYLCYTYNIHPADIKGHKDVNSTDCPGTNIYSQLSSIRDEVCYKLWPNERPN